MCFFLLRWFDQPAEVCAESGCSFWLTCAIRIPSTCYTKAGQIRPDPTFCFAAKAVVVDFVVNDREQERRRALPMLGDVSDPASTRERKRDVFTGRQRRIKNGQGARGKVAEREAISKTTMPQIVGLQLSISACFPNPNRVNWTVHFTIAPEVTLTLAHLRRWANLLIFSPTRPLCWF